MILVAICIDGVQSLTYMLLFIPIVGLVLAPVLGFIISMVANVFFGLCFSHLGMSLYSSTRSGKTLLVMVLEYTPGFNAIWWWTILISYTVFTEWRRKDEI